ncbi:hypothetical protein NQ318_008550 [Aromia moschata]|uniref:Uncharacterized protein n=1 Tax=Aromia moschata TaxID=1265417 RepID=A0AAV8YVX1_9CUCU|nr:hypothetical protein NQ318_008550 [Aromia moschata]
MSVLAVMVALAAVVASQAHPISQEDKERLYMYHRDCLAKTGIDEKIVEQAGNGQFAEDAQLKDYFFCLSQRLGMMNETGDLQTEVIRKKLEKHITDAKEIDILIEKCAVRKDTPAETAFNMLKCYQENSESHGEFIFYVVSVTAEKREKIKKLCKECREETNVAESLVQAARKGEYSDDPNFKRFALCMSKKFQFQDEKGAIQADMIKEKLTSAFQDNAKVEKIYNKCVSEKETPEDTAIGILKCFPPEKKEKIVTYHKECVAQTSVDKALLRATRKGEFADDPKLKEYFLCMSKKAEFQNEDGDIQKDILRQKLGDIIKDPVTMQQLIEKCALKKDTPQNTAFSTVKCFYDNSPNHVSIFQIAIITEEQRQKLTRINKECQTESGIDSDTLEKAKKGHFSKDDKFKNHLFCFYKNLGLQNETGLIQKEVLSEKIGKLLNDVSLSEKLIEKCAIQKDTPQDTAYEAFTCYYENTPSHFNILALI